VCNSMDCDVVSLPTLTSTHSQAEFFGISLDENELKKRDPTQADVIELNVSPAVALCIPLILWVPQGGGPGVLCFKGDYQCVECVRRMAD
jgi:hypothetical protein